MINRLDAKFKSLTEQGEKAFVAYVAAGDPGYEQSLEVIKGIADVGADVIELGLPFSDPVADGIVNQMAAERAINAGMTTLKTLQLVRDFRKTHETPIVIFTYLNPVYSYGYEAFVKDAKEAGVDGLLLLDLPPDEALQNAELIQSKELKHIRLIAPTSPMDRIQMLAESSEGFVYALSRTGVTGAQAAPSASVAETVSVIKKFTDTPVCIGFGINTPDQAQAVAEHCDGVIVGSAIVKQIAENADNQEVASIVANFVKPLIEATKRG